MASIRELCAQHDPPLIGGAYYQAMSAYNTAGRITEDDRTAMDGLSEAGRLDYVAIKYESENVQIVALADYYATEAR